MVLNVCAFQITLALAKMLVQTAQEAGYGILLLNVVVVPTILISMAFSALLAMAEWFSIASITNVHAPQINYGTPAVASSPALLLLFTTINNALVPSTPHSPEMAHALQAQRAPALKLGTALLVPPLAAQRDLSGTEVSVFNTVKLALWTPIGTAKVARHWM